MYFNSLNGFLMLLIFQVSLEGCSGKGSFAGGSKKLQTAPNGANPGKEGLPGGSGDGTDGGTPVTKTSFSSGLPDFRSSVGKRDIWTVTEPGAVTRFSLQPGATSKDTEVWAKNGEWQLDGGLSGHRTFVTEIGLIIGKTGGGFYRIGDETPQKTVQPTVPVLYKPSDIGGSRLCVTSFKVGAQAYIGGGYTAGTNRKFVKIPIDTTKANKVDLAALKTLSAGSGASWGYSCFTDQASSTYWGAYNTNITGFNFATEANVATPPNGWVSQTAGSVSFNSNMRAAYAISGDAKGRIVNAAGYTFAHDLVSDLNFQSDSNAQMLRLIKDKCLDVGATCTDNNGVWSFALPLGLEALGPLSSLNDGRVVGAIRDSGDIYIISLKDIADPSKGVSFRKIGNAGGDPYMYTDFTGATLYALDTERSLTIAPASGLVAGKKVSKLNLKWIADSGLTEPWRGLRLEIRCYAKGGAVPAYAAVTPVADSGVEFAVSAASCIGAAYDTVDIHIVPENTTGGFSRTAAFVISGEQG